MAEPAVQSRISLRTLTAFGLVFVLLLWAEGSDALSGLTRPVVIALFRLLRISAEDHGHNLRIAGLTVPWTRDCAGLNFMALLPALVIWLHRNIPSTRRYLLRILLSLPAAFLANLCRILTLILYRKLFYPQVESPALHYFIGFLWLFPFLFLMTGRRPGPGETSAMESFYWACALSMLAPFVTSPGGTRVAACALLLLARNHPRSLSRASLPLAGLWLLGGGVIGWTHMESLWSPWILTCPLFMDLRLWRQPERVLLLAGTVPLFSMQPWSLPLLGIAAGLQMLRFFRGAPDSREPAPARTASTALCAAALLMPFVLSIIPLSPVPDIPPPPGLMASRADAHAHLIRLVGQPANIHAVWYEPFGHGRHHTLPVCMRFRGVELVPSRLQSGVFQDDHFWMREAFLVNGRAMDYPRYVLSTFLPFSTPGVHIIYSAPKNSTDPIRFALETDGLTRRILGLSNVSEPRRAHRFTAAKLPE